MVRYLAINHQLAKIHGHSPWWRGYGIVTTLIWHVITHQKVVRGLYDSIGLFLSPWVTNLPSLILGDLVEEDILNFQSVTWPQVITWSESHMAIWVSFCHHNLPPCKVWWLKILQKGKYFVFNLSRDIRWTLGNRDMSNYGSVFPIIIHHPADIGGHRGCAREDISFLLCLLISLDYVFRDSPDIMGDFPSLYVTTLQNLVIIDL